MKREIVNGVVVLRPEDGLVITLRAQVEGAEPLKSTEVRLSRNDSEDRYTEVAPEELAESEEPQLPYEPPVEEEYYE